MKAHLYIAIPALTATGALTCQIYAAKIEGYLEFCTHLIPHLNNTFELQQNNQ